MKILGIGVDIVDNKRLKLLIRNRTFINRIYSKKEKSNSKKFLNKLNYFSKRFAAKEAFAKCLGTGFRKKLNFKDIEILNNPIGKPFYSKSKKIDKLIFKRFNIKKYSLFLSITDEKNYSIAFTILQTK
tara:strand:+ start:1552 stop:1938 length:387 start_codon:yes stop_codon:yes gene_type:complete